MKVGSEVQFTTSLLLDPVDQLNRLNQLACAKVVFRARGTLLFALKTQEWQYCVFGLSLGEAKPLQARWGELPTL